MAYQILLVCAGSCLLSAGMIYAALPIAARLALAIPNERSSHKVPTPQVGGLFITLTLIIFAIVGMVIHSQWRMALAPLIVAISLLCLIGWLDDRRGLPIGFRLLAYIGVSVYFGFSQNYHFLPEALPFWLNGLVASVFLLSLMNVSNFMDGIDGMLVVEFLPMLALAALLAFFGSIGNLESLVAASLAGALVGFFIFNRPKAKIFMGDSGSLVVGFLGGIILLGLANQYGFWIALTLPMYFLMDAGLTLARRLLRGEAFWMAHRQHFYQRAFDNGQSNWSIIGRVLLCNVALSTIAFYAVCIGFVSESLSFGLSLICVTMLVVSLGRSHRVPARMAKDFI